MNGKKDKQAAKVSKQAVTAPAGKQAAKVSHQAVTAPGGKQAAKVSPQAATAPGVKKTPENRVGQGLGSRNKTKTDEKGTKQDNTDVNLGVEELIDTLSGSDGVQLFEEFKDILRFFKIQSMKELRKRLEFEKGAVSESAEKEIQGKKKDRILKHLNEQKRISESGTPKKDEKPKSSLQDTENEIKALQSNLEIAKDEREELIEKLKNKEREIEILKEQLVSTTVKSITIENKLEVKIGPSNTVASAELEKSNQEKDREQKKAEAKVRELEIKLGTTKIGKQKAEAKAQDLEIKLETTKTEQMKAETKIQDLEMKLETTKSEQMKAETKIQDLEMKLETTKSEQKKAETKIQDLEMKLETTKSEIRKSLSPDTRKLKDEIDQLKNRLSQLAGSKLTEGNPAIADLSDMNRPINLGEKFSELYDNQWTDAFEELSEKEIKDEKVISELFKTVTEAYEFCTKQSEDFHHKLKDLMKQFSMDPKKLPTEVSKQIKDYRKGLAVSLLQDVQEGFCKKQKKIKESQVKMYAYARRCIAVCWFMTVQDPPVFMDANPGNSVFDNDKFRAYTRTGKQIDYLVWPALYLHAEGPLLSKGVAQGK